MLDMNLMLNVDNDNVVVVHDDNCSSNSTKASIKPRATKNAKKNIG